MKRAMAVLVAGLFVMMEVPASFAAGFRLPEQDTAAMGMASAFVGQADNASAAWYNPAAMTQLDGTRASAGVIAIFPSFEHTNNTINAGTTDVSQRETHLPPHLYMTHKMNDKVAFGIAVNSPFGLSTDWDPTTSSTRYVATYSKVVTSEVNPSVAYKISDDLSAAVGIAYVRLRATLEKTVFVVHPIFGPLGDHNFRLSGDGDGWGVNAALMYKQSDATNIGFTYRSRVKVDVDGTASLSGGPAATTATGATAITLPDLIQFGVSHKASENLTVNADIDYTMWSTYDRVVVTSNNPQFNNTDEKQWKNVWCLRIGGQYKLTDEWKLRAGYLYDKNPVGEAHFENRVPDSDRQGLSLGTGYAKGNISVDLAYLYLLFNKRTISSSLSDNATPNVDSLNGTYKGSANLVGVTVGYKF